GPHAPKRLAGRERVDERPGRACVALVALHAVDALDALDALNALRTRWACESHRTALTAKRADRLLRQIGPLDRPVRDLLRADAIRRQLHGGVGRAAERDEERQQRDVVAS